MALFRVAAALLIVGMPSSDIKAQESAQVFSVAAARQNAPRLQSKQIEVRGHIWWGKEGSMIYDSHYKAILKLQTSDAFNAKYSWEDVLHNVRQSNLVTAIGHLHREPDGQLLFVADDIDFLPASNGSTPNHSTASPTR